VVNLGGLARSDAAGGFEAEFAALAEEITQAHDGSQLTGSASRPGDKQASLDAAEIFEDSGSPGRDSAADDESPVSGNEPASGAGGPSAGTGDHPSSATGGTTPGRLSAQNDREPSLSHNEGE
jgi:hypothetical protein